MQRRLCLFVASLAALTAMGPPAATAKIRELPLRTVADDVRLAQAADATTLGYRLQSAADAMVRSDDRVTRRVPAPAGCSAAAFGSGRVAYECDESSVRVEHFPGLGWRLPRHLAVTSLTGEEHVDVQVLSPMTWVHAMSVADVGAQWIASPGGAHHARSSVEYINWRTSEIRGMQAWDLTLRPDLDAPGLLAPICDPLRARANPDPGEYDLDWNRFDVTIRSGWALVGLSETRARLYRCGRAAPVRLPRVFVNPVLGAGWIGEVRYEQERGLIELLRLRDRRRFRVRLPRGYYGSRLTFTRGRLYTLEMGGELKTAQLPRR